MSTAAEFALEKVSRVRDDPDARLALLRRLYAGPGGDGTTHLPYRCAAVAFVRRQLRRGFFDRCTVRGQAVPGGGRSTSGCCGPRRGSPSAGSRRSHPRSATHG